MEVRRWNKVAKMLHFFKRYSLVIISAVGLLVALYSSGACYLWFVHQRKCPESLIKTD